MGLFLVSWRQQTLSRLGTFVGAISSFCDILFFFFPSSPRKFLFILVLSTVIPPARVGGSLYRSPMVARSSLRSTRPSFVIICMFSFFHTGLFLVDSTQDRRTFGPWKEKLNVPQLGPCRWCTGSKRLQETLLSTASDSHPPSPPSFLIQ